MIHPKNLKWIELRDIVEDFRSKCERDMIQVPVPILEYIELDLKIDVVPIQDLEQNFNINGFLSQDAKKLFIDNDIYYDDRYTNRLRFTAAHEIGHMVLHKEQIEACKFDTPEEWIKIRESITSDSLKWFELQAYEFGGRLLVPYNRLFDEVNKSRDKIEKYIEIMGDNNIEELADYLSPKISKVFQVSEQVLTRRLRTEKILENL